MRTTSERSSALSGRMRGPPGFSGVLAMSPREDFVDQGLRPDRTLGETAAQEQEVGLAAGLAAVVEGAEARASLGHHVEAEPGAVRLLVAVPVLELVLAHALDGLGEASGH